MRRLDLDFVTRPTALQRLGLVCLAIAMVSVVYLAQIYLERSDELQTWETTWQNLQKTQRFDGQQSRAQTTGDERLQAELNIANRVIANLSTPWDSLFDAISVSTYDEVVLLNLEPDREKQEIRIIAEGKNFAAMLEYLRRLQSTALFHDAYLASHQIQIQAPQESVRFVVHSQWKSVSY